MFNNKKIASINNKINSNDTVTLPKQNNTLIPVIPVKITAVTLVGSVYKYSWEAVKNDGTLDPNYGKSTNDTRALAICEIGQTMTSSSPSAYKVNDIVPMRKSMRGHLLLSSNFVSGITNPMLDLTQSDDSKDTIGWESGFKTTNDVITGTTETGVKVKYLVRTHYDYTTDLNYEYYRVIEFDSKGLLKKVYKVVSVNGFETTLHT